MIKRSTFLFFFVFMLLKTEIFSMTTETEEPRSRYMPVFRQIVRFHEFLCEEQNDIPDFQKGTLNADLTLANKTFHDFIPTSPYEVRELKNKDQSFIDSVFNAREFKNITYGDFETF